MADSYVESWNNYENKAKRCLFYCQPMFVCDYMNWRVNENVLFILDNY